MVQPAGRDQRESHQRTEEWLWHGTASVWDLRGQCRLLSHWRVSLQPVCVVQVVGVALCLEPVPSAHGALAAVSGGGQSGPACWCRDPQSATTAVGLV